jgi:hypothetical protein
MLSVEDDLLWELVSLLEWLFLNERLVPVIGPRARPDRPGRDALGTNLGI